MLWKRAMYDVFKAGQIYSQFTKHTNEFVKIKWVNVCKALRNCLVHSKHSIIIIIT